VSLHRPAAQPLQISPGSSQRSLEQRWRELLSQELHYRT